MERTPDRQGRDAKRNRPSRPWRTMPGGGAVRPHFQRRLRVSRCRLASQPNDSHVVSHSLGGHSKLRSPQRARQSRSSQARDASRPAEFALWVCPAAVGSLASRSPVAGAPAVHVRGGSQARTSASLSLSCRFRATLFQSADPLPAVRTKNGSTKPKACLRRTPARPRP